jgi:hypothetical protein
LAWIGRPNCGLPTIVLTLAKRHAIEDVGGVEPPVQGEAIAPQKRAPEARVHRELRRAANRIASRIAPAAGGRQNVGGRIRVRAGRDSVDPGHTIRAHRPDNARSRNRGQHDRSQRQAAAGGQLARDRPSLEQRAAHAGGQRAASDADAGRELHLRRQQMTLIEVGCRALGVQVEPVLRDGHAAETHARERRRRIVSRLRERVLSGRRHTVSQPAPQQQLTRVPGRTAVRREVHES